MCRFLIRHRMARVFSAPMSVQERRERIHKLSTSPHRTDVKSREAKLGGCRIRWLESVDTNDSDPVLLYVHGGAFVTGSPETHVHLPAHLAHTAGMRVLLPAYRLAPEHTYPAASDDVLRVYEALLQTLPNGVPVILSGDSAGGLIALQTLLRLRDARGPLPAGLLLFSPITDAVRFDGATYDTEARNDPWFTRDVLRPLVAMYAPDADPQELALCPKRADLTGFPPMHVEVGENEVLRSDSEDLVLQAQRHGVHASLHCEPNMWHVYASLAPVVPEATVAVTRVARWLMDCADGRLAGAQARAS